MNIFVAQDVFHELTSEGYRVSCKLAYYPVDDEDDDENSYQIEIQTPLPSGMPAKIKRLKKTFKFSEIRTPVTFGHAGRYGKLVLQ